MSEADQEAPSVPELEPMPEEQEGERGEQTVTVADVGAGRKALTIEIPQERVAQALEKSFKKLRGDAQVPGFRRGRAPLRLLQRRFGSDVKEDVKGQLISAAYTQAIEDEKLEVIGEPDVKDVETITLPDEGPLTLKVEVEVSPQVELPDFQAIEITKKKQELADADVEAEVTRLRERFGSMLEVEGPVQADDYLQAFVHIRAAEDGGEGEEGAIAHHHETYIHVNGETLDYKGHVAGIVVENLGKQLIGKNKGDELTIEMTGPAAHEEERIRNQPIKIEIRIDVIRRMERAPEEELPGLVGLESMDELRNNIRTQLERRNTLRQKDEMRKQASAYLLEKVEMTLPEGMTRRQTERQQWRQRAEMMYQGVPTEQIEQRLAELRSSSEEEARKQLKLFFILNQAAKSLETEVTEQEINGQIAAMAVQQNRRPEKLRQELQQRGELQHIYLQIREQKTLDQIVAKAKVTEES